MCGEGMQSRAGAHWTEVLWSLLGDLIVCQEVADGDRDLLGERVGLGARSGGKRVAPMVQHLLGEVAGGGLDPKVAEHGV